VTILHRLTNLKWTANVLTPVMVILMEVCWVYPWLFWVGKWQTLVLQRPPLSLVSLILLVGISFLVTRFFLGKRWRLRWIRLSLVSIGLVTIFLLVRIEYGAGFGLLSGQWFVRMAQILLDSFSHPHPVVISLVAGVYLWWRGMSWGRSFLNFDYIYHSFLVGLIALVGLILVWGINAGAGTLGNLFTTAGLYVAGFFFFGLAALALGNRQAIHQKMLRRGEVVQVFSRRWFFILFGVIGGIILVGIGVASIFSFDLVAFVGRQLSLVADLLLQVLYYLALAVGYLLVGLFYIGKFILNLLRGEQTMEPFQPPNFDNLRPLQQDTATQALSPEVILVIKWAFFAIVAAAVVFLLARAVSRYGSSRAKEEIEETHESLWGWDVFKADLRLFLSMLWQRFKGKRKQSVQATAIPVWYTKEDIPGNLDIREIYRHLLWEAAGQGVARRSHETAYEYAERLGQAAPDGSEQLAQLTALYVDIRYGELKAQDKQRSQANILWRVLRRLLRRLRGD